MLIRAFKAASIAPVGAARASDVGTQAAKAMVVLLGSARVAQIDVANVMHSLAAGHVTVLLANGLDLLSFIAILVLVQKLLSGDDVRDTDVRARRSRKKVRGGTIQEPPRHISRRPYSFSTGPEVQGGNPDFRRPSMGPADVVDDDVIEVIDLCGEEDEEEDEVHEVVDFCGEDDEDKSADPVVEEGAEADPLDSPQRSACDDLFLGPCCPAEQWEHGSRPGRPAGELVVRFSL